MARRPVPLDYPRVTIRGLYRLLARANEGRAQKYDFVWTATASGWATDGRFLVALGEAGARAWRALPDPQCHPSYGEPRGKAPPYEDLLGRARRWRPGPVAEAAAEMQWDGGLGEVICTLAGGAGGPVRILARSFALVRMLWPECQWHVPKEGLALARAAGELVAVVAPLVD